LAIKLAQLAEAMQALSSGSAKRLMWRRSAHMAGQFWLLRDWGFPLFLAELACGVRTFHALGSRGEEDAMKRLAIAALLLVTGAVAAHAADAKVVVAPAPVVAAPAIVATPVMVEGVPVVVTKPPPRVQYGCKRIWRCDKQVCEWRRGCWGIYGYMEGPYYSQELARRQWERDGWPTSGARATAAPAGNGGPVYLNRAK
jgi:hypothetical protein